MMWYIKQENIAHDTHAATDLKDEKGNGEGERNKIDEKVGAWKA